jgi:uncharacterized protein YcbX
MQSPPQSSGRPTVRSGRIAGRVAGLWRYPVKSMAAEGLAAADVSWHGLAGDRRWAFIRDGMAHSGLPWLTIRHCPEMAHFRPSFTDPDRPDVSPAIVHTPTGEVFDVTDPALAAELAARARVIKQNRGVFDAMPLSVITTQAIASIGNLTGLELDPVRFRPNVLIDAAGEEAFPEDAWIGSVLRIGNMRMRVDQQDQRCVMVTIDPVTLKRSPAVLRAITREHGVCLGVYGSTTQPGRVVLGDPVIIDG